MNTHNLSLSPRSQSIPQRTARLPVVVRWFFSSHTQQNMHTARTAHTTRTTRALSTLSLAAALCASLTVSLAASCGNQTSPVTSPVTSPQTSTNGPSKPVADTTNPETQPALTPQQAMRAGQPQMIVAKGQVSTQSDSGPVTFQVELAQTPVERQVGLMFRRQMDELVGMLFVFDAMSVHSFWMRNTYLPLDMLFIDDAGVVVGIVENAEPLTESPRTVGKPSQYVLELNAGTCRRLGIRAGHQFTFTGIAGHPTRKLQ